MAYLRDSKSAAVRAQLDHPVIDGDGHWLEHLFAADVELALGLAA